MDNRNWLRQLRGFAKPLTKVTLAVFLGLLVFELAQDLLWPGLPKWQSHTVEVVYAAVLAGTVGYFALRMHNVLYQQVLEENEKYRNSEAEMLRNKEWFRALTEHSTDLITVIDRNGTILYDSPSMERILGYRPIDRLGKSGFDLVHPEDIPGARSIIERAFQKLGSIHTAEMRVRGLDGRWHVFESIGKAILDHEGKLCGVINSRDITERKRIVLHSRRLEQLATISQLLGGIAHGMKNPMFVLTGRIQLVKEMLAGRQYETLGEDLAKIEEAARRMTAIIDRFLLLAKPAKPETRLCSIQTVLQEVLDLLSTELMQHRIRVVTSFTPALPETTSDPRQLQEIFLNLILNAIQAMTEAQGKGTLTVTTRLADGWIETRVQDDGPGITLEHQPKLFEPFFSTKKPGEGTGMGLWNVRVALMQLKSEIRCESEVGKGTTFIVRLPVSP